MSAQQQIEELVKSKDVVLFMKGRRRLPQCGFSATVVGMLDQLLDDYETVNVLDDPAIRQGIKEYSDWPTIPQLYIKGEFVGGCDIVTQLFGQGELHSMLGVEIKEVPEPKVTVTDSAKEAFADALKEMPGHHVRLDVDARFRPNLDIDTKKDFDFAVETNGLSVLVAKTSAERCDGVTIDFVPGDSGGFKIENPNEPPRVRNISPKELKARLEAGEKIEIFDVRPDEERAIAKLDFAHCLHASGQAHLRGLDQDNDVVVFHCHHGGRSQVAAEEAIRAGYKKVYNLAGGIDAWSKEVDSRIPQY